ncbi:flagellar filament capping protein FliD [Modestobacter muralis]|uniref:Flagellar hook-associated protein 2 n=1 Tax=Modestobacter muralis TaxID=1608614 RepID=A0A6P0HAE3_9ACTN|nr:flagellar filament capping protein FliD [Modestobacter muralis]NEK94918.1 flagellar filament capping protein FliD [Modestobacter muralis]NEN51806.1 flagellar filament capping protein FliD [Modestobacter muralis]
MSVSTGLISGINYDTMIGQLMQVEANPQKLLQNKLVDTKADAAAYRAVNTKFDALRSAAEALTKSVTFAAAKASSTSTDVVATASPTAQPGSQVSFSVLSVARTHAEVTSGEWGSRTAAAATGGPGWPLTITDGAGKSATVSLPADGTLTDAASAINSAGLGVRATVVQLAADRFRLQLTSTTSGEDGVFTVSETPRTDGAMTGGFTLLAQGQDATLDLGGPGLIAKSATNTFTDLVPGVTFTVGKADTTGTTTTVSVASDPTAVSTAVKTMVDAANAVLSAIAAQTDTSSGSKAALKGDSTLRSLTSSVLSTISTAIGGASTSSVGISLTRDGRFSFDSEKFTAALAADPAKAQALVNGSDAVTAPDGTVTPAVKGVAQRLLELSKQASNATTGILVLRAKGEDDEALGLTSQIEDWDRRLQLREASITARFNAMETALGTLQSKSSWLSSQLASLSKSS